MGKGNTRKKDEQHKGKIKGKSPAKTNRTRNEPDLDQRSVVANVNKTNKRSSQSVQNAQNEQESGQKKCRRELQNDAYQDNQITEVEFTENGNTVQMTVENSIDANQIIERRRRRNP